MTTGPALNALYPHMRRRGEQLRASAQSLRHSVESKARDHTEVFGKFFAEQADELVAAATTLAASYRQGGRLLAMGNGVDVPEGTTSSQPYSVFMDVYAAMARAHMKTYGSTQAQIAAVSAKNHMHSTRNLLAQYRLPYTVESVLAAPPIVYPFTLPMCSPISDGAAAAIICSEAGRRKLSAAPDRALRILASVLQTGAARDPFDYDHHVSRLAANRAYAMAGVGPEDIGVEIGSMGQVGLRRVVERIYQPVRKVDCEWLSGDDPTAVAKILAAKLAEEKFRTFLPC